MFFFFLNLVALMQGSRGMNEIWSSFVVKSLVKSMFDS